MHYRSWNCMEMLGQVPGLASESLEERSHTIICVEGWVVPEVIVGVVAKRNMSASDRNCTLVSILQPVWWAITFFNRCLLANPASPK